MGGNGFTLAELAQRAACVAQGPQALHLDGVATLDDAGPTSVAFFNHPRYLTAFLASKAGAFVVEAKIAAQHPGRTYLVAHSASLAFTQIVRAFFPDAPPEPARHPSAYIDPSAEVDPTARVDALAYVGPRARVGPRTHLSPQSLVDAGARIGADGRVGPGAKVLRGCVLGDRVIVQAGCVLGGDGFGFAFDPAQGQHLKTPQVGAVVIEDDVEIGANSCIDRAALGETRIGRGTKIDNLVQVGHNVTVGPLSILCGQVGLAGSCHIGAGAVLGGQVGVANHLHVGEGARLAAQSGVAADVPPKETWAGSPAQPHRAWLRGHLAARGIAELIAEVRRLRARLDAQER